MNPDQLLSKQGPLAHVWLAANYDKKLSKQQLLNTNIITSSKYISNHPLVFDSRSSSSQPSDQSQQQTVGTITLRLSGQLLLGIVRIYSRKTKYLLDDVNDTLYKLKNSFKIASGGSVLGGGNGNDNDSFNINVINLPPQQTTLSNMNNIMLRDQVADFDLLYQEDLNLDDDSPASSGAAVANTLFSQVNSSVNNNEDSFNFDQSIEYPRYADDDMGGDIGGNYDDMGGDIDLELDFDLNDDENNNDDGASDRSIEVGRNTSMSQIDNPEISLLDINTKEDENNFDLGNPLETIDQVITPPENEPSTPTDEPEPRHISRPRKAIVGITETGELRTNKRKLVVDAPEELETGIPTSTLRDIQRLQVSDDLAEVTISLSDSQKLQLIQELSCPVAATNKRRKLWNIDDRLQQECLRLSRQEEEEAQKERHEELNWDQDNFGNDFDLSLPDLESDRDDDNNHDDSLPLEELPLEDEFESQVDEFNNENKTKASIQVAGHLRDAFNNDSVVQLSQIIEKDLAITNVEDSKFPLGTTRKTDDSIKINNRREATTCFFELLVLATQDCISIDQASPAEPTQIGGQINIRSKDKLFSNFL